MVEKESIMNHRRLARQMRLSRYRRNEGETISGRRASLLLCEVSLTEAAIRRVADLEVDAPIGAVAETLQPFYVIDDVDDFNLTMLRLDGMLEGVELDSAPMCGLPLEVTSNPDFISAIDHLDGLIQLPAEEEDMGEEGETTTLVAESKMDADQWIAVASLGVLFGGAFWWAWKTYKSG